MPRGVHVNLTGQRFGLWLVLQREPNRGRDVRYTCRCDCGTERSVSAGTLQKGQSISCGCYRNDLLRENSITHGYISNPETAAMYRAWKTLIARCTNPNHDSYPHYGGRGIKVCDRWLNFANFLADMGIRPSDKHSIERRNNDGGYEPSNCHWALKQEQMRNMRSNRNITYNGRTQCAKAWAEEYNIPYGTFWCRLNIGWDIERALLTPIQ